MMRHRLDARGPQLGGFRARDVSAATASGSADVEARLLGASTTTGLRGDPGGRERGASTPAASAGDR